MFAALLAPQWISPMMCGGRDLTEELVMNPFLARMAAIYNLQKWLGKNMSLRYERL